MIDRLRTTAWRSYRLTLVAVASVPALADGAGQAEPPAKIDFARDIQPLFEKHCYECHGPKKQEAGLRLDQRAAALAGGDLGRDIVPGKSGESLLVAAIGGTTDEVSRMPAKGEPLSADQIALVKRWIDQGRSWPETTQSATAKDPRASIGLSSRRCGRPCRR